MEIDTSAVVRRDAMALLATREHSVQELRRKLRGKNHGQLVIEEVLEQLIAEGIQSDARFTETYIYQRAGRGFGPTKINIELHERGVPEAFIARYLNEDDDMWMDVLAREHLKKFNNHMPEDYAERASQMRFFQYRGFTSKQIHRFYSESRDVLIEQFV